MFLIMEGNTKMKERPNSATTPAAPLKCNNCDHEITGREFRFHVLGYSFVFCGDACRKAFLKATHIAD